jgi:hypothetical protein
MTDDVRNDPVLAALRELRVLDVDDVRAHRLRRRCRAALGPGSPPAIAAAVAEAAFWRRTAGPVLVGAWCAIYLVETLRQAAAVYGF